jgi:tRNA/rRNA methyltransferase
MNLDHLCVVLVGSRGERNIGSVARAMANFGITDLRLVQPATNHLDEEARKMACNASLLLEQARVYDDLATALNDCHLAFGTTRRFGKYRSHLLHPEEAGEQAVAALDAGQVAMVFGREDHGLKTEELDLCQRLITIPTLDMLPSMNLAQSVGVCLYEFSRAHGRASGKTPGDKQLATGEELESMFSHMRESLLHIGYLNPQNPDHIMRAYRQIFGRAGLDSREVRILRGLWSILDEVEAERHRLETAGKNEPV